jgi:alkylation response protein AidB-like acyl-CoA dehydrogenase
MCPATTSPPPTPPSPGEFRSDAARFLAESIAADVHCPAFGAIMPPALHDRARAWQRRVFDAGFAGIHWPTAYGGRGLDRTFSAIWAEECAKVEAQPTLNLQGLVLAGEAIMRHGTPEQQARLLRPTLTGERLWCQLFSEPEAGSDLAGLRTTAVRDGDRYVVNGQKVWCSNGQFADDGIMLARTDPTRPGHRGISFFLVDMRSPGVEVRAVTQMTGDQEFCEVFLDDVDLPADALLGPEHGGWLVAMEVLQDERASVGAAGLISLDRRLGRLARLRGDSPDDELLRVLARGQAVRTMLKRSGSDPSLASASKLMRTELEFDAELVESSMRGADAMLAGDATDRFLYSPGMRIAGGTSEIQRNIIGERILGLPREP